MAVVRDANAFGVVELAGPFSVTPKHEFKFQVPTQDLHSVVAMVWSSALKNDGQNSGHRLGQLVRALSRSQRDRISIDF